MSCMWPHVATAETNDRVDMADNARRWTSPSSGL